MGFVTSVDIEWEEGGFAIESQAKVARTKVRRTNRSQYPWRMIDMGRDKFPCF